METGNHPAFHILAYYKYIGLEIDFILRAQQEELLHSLTKRIHDPIFPNAVRRVIILFYPSVQAFRFGRKDFDNQVRRRKEKLVFFKGSHFFG